MCMQLYRQRLPFLKLLWKCMRLYQAGTALSKQTLVAYAVVSDKGYPSWTYSGCICSCIRQGLPFLNLLEMRTQLYQTRVTLPELTRDAYTVVSDKDYPSWTYSGCVCSCIRQGLPFLNLLGMHIQLYQTRTILPELTPDAYAVVSDKGYPSWTYSGCVCSCIRQGLPFLNLLGMHMLLYQTRTTLPELTRDAYAVVSDKGYPSWTYSGCICSCIRQGLPFLNLLGISTPFQEVLALAILDAHVNNLFYSEFFFFPLVSSASLGISVHLILLVLRHGSAIQTGTRWVTGSKDQSPLRIQDSRQGNSRQQQGIRKFWCISTKLC